MKNHIVIHAQAKINLGLHILRRLPNGYHELETLFYPIPEIRDELRLETQPEGCVIHMEGLNEALAAEDNLIYKAWAALRAQVPGLGGLQVSVRKGIPAGAGLGGGSSDAAAVLRGLRELYDLPMGDAQLAEIGAGLGADVPFFIYGRPMFGSGTGTELRPFDIDLRAYRIAVRPLPIHSSTAEAYRGLDPAGLGGHPDLAESLRLPPEQWRDCVFNDLEGPVFARLPEVAQAKAELYAEGAVYAAMSGSGSAVFGIFRF